MNQSFKKNSIVAACIMVLPLTIIAKTSQITEEEPSYLDQQSASLVTRDTLMADTSQKSYTEEFVPFAGLYLSGVPLFQMTTGKNTISYHSQTSEFNMKAHELGLNFNLGYGQNWSGFYLGSEAFLNYASTDMNAGVNNGLKHGEVTSHYDGGAALRMGYTATPNLLWYVLGCLDVAKFKVASEKDSDFASPENNKTIMGFMPGIGMEFLANANWGFKAQYTYTIFSNFNDNYHYADKTAVENQYKLNRSNFTLGVVYHF